MEAHGTNHLYSYSPDSFVCRQIPAVGLSWLEVFDGRAT